MMKVLIPCLHPYKGRGNKDVIPRMPRMMQAVIPRRGCRRLDMSSNTRALRGSMSNKYSNAYPVLTFLILVYHGSTIACSTLKRLLRHRLAGTGPFKVEQAIVEPWYTNVKNISTGYVLLYLLLMDPRKARVLDDMSRRRQPRRGITACIVRGIRGITSLFPRPLYGSRQEIRTFVI